MPGIGFTFQDTESRDTSGRWVTPVIVIIVVAATIGVVLLFRAFGIAEANGGGGQAAVPAANEDVATSTPAGKTPASPSAVKGGDGAPAVGKDTTPTKPAANKSPAEAAPSAPTASTPSTPSASVKPASKRVQSLMREAAEAEAADDFQTARERYLAALAAPDCGDARDKAEERLGEIDIALITSPRKMEGKVDYSIQGGDSIDKIAKKFGTTVDLIVKANDIPNPNRIQAGYRLRVLDKPHFAITVSKSRNDLVVTLGGKFFKRYPVGTGKFAKTPHGTFRVSDKIPEPPWWRPDGKVVPFGDKENILGTRWMAIEPTGDTGPARGYGIHGTWDDASIGSQSSAGCVRMHNADVEELFIYIPVGTEVVIEE